jgi:putative ABC transport system substrate-binding protein
MKRREFITLLGGAAASLPLTARAQQSNRLRRIGTLLTGNDPQFGDAFREALEKLGWVEGRNVHIDQRFHMGDPERMQTYADELVKLSPDVILAATPVEAKVLRQETNIIPIVFAAGVDPVSQGIVDSFAHPGGNITGCSSFESSLGGKWIQSLKEMAPNISRVGIVFNPLTATYIQTIVHSVEVAAGPLRVEVLAIPVHDVTELEHSVASLAQRSDSAIIFPPDIFSSGKIKAIIELVAQYRLPAIYAVPVYAKFGGLLAYGPNFLDNYRRAATLVNRILKGAKPADLPIEQPDKFLLAVNLKTARQLGLEIPPTLLAIADEVIE